jgi:DNA-binding transcriptional ArsR family regulator
VKREPQANSAAGRKLADLEAVFTALAHPSRRHILLVLHYRGGSMTAGEIANRFACSWPTTTRHLQTLEAAGLVRVKKTGRERIYHLDRARLREVVGDWLKPFHDGD